MHRLRLAARWVLIAVHFTCKQPDKRSICALPLALSRRPVPPLNVAAQSMSSSHIPTTRVLSTRAASLPAAGIRSNAQSKGAQ